MRSKNWCCKLSLPLIRKDITRFWPVWGSYLAIWLLVLPIPLLTSYNPAGSTSETIRSIHRQLVGVGGEATLVMTGIYGGVAALAVWSYLCQHRSASLFHALPVTRETLFVSHFTAGLGFLVAPNVVIAVITYLCQASLGYFDPTQLLCWLASACLSGLLFYAIGTFAAMCTGSLPAMPVLYGLLNFAVVVCEGLLGAFATDLYFGVTSLDTRFTFLSPFAQLLATSPGVIRQYQVTADGAWESFRFYNPEFLLALCLYALAALALALCALLLYRRRATESAGDVIAFSWLKPAAKYAFAFGCALVLGWIFQQIVFPSAESALVLLLCMALGGAVGYIAALMLLKKSFRVFRLRQMAGLGVLWMVLGCLLLAWELDLFGVEARVPDAGQVKRATLYSDYEIDLDDPREIDQVIALHQDILKSKDAIESLPLGQPSCYVRLNYTLENGETLRRSYNLPYTDALAGDPAAPTGKLAAIMEDPGHLVESLLPPADAVIESVHLNLRSETLLAQAGPAIDARHGGGYVDTGHIPLLLEALETDIRAGRLSAWRSGQKYTSYDYLCSIEINYDLYDRPLSDAADPKAVPGTMPGSTEMASHWKSINIYTYDDPQRTLEVLYRLGYLTEGQAAHE